MADGEPSGAYREFKALVEAADRKFARARDLPLYGGGDHHSRKAFKAYTRLWRLQQDRRRDLVAAGLRRWEIGEVASRIGQLYYARYLRTAEPRSLVGAYVFYEAIYSRGYFAAPAPANANASAAAGGGAKHQGLLIRYKELRFIARFLVVAMLMRRAEAVDHLVARLRSLVKFTELTLDTFRMLQSLEWEPTGSYQIAVKELTENGTMVLATICEELSQDSILLIYISASGPNNLYPEDLIPFTRYPLFLVVDSENSHAFKAIHNAEKGEPAALLLSPRIASAMHGVESMGNAGQFTYFLTAPMQAFCQLAGITSDIDSYEEILSTSVGLNIVWGQILPDPFLRRLILRFIFCRAVLFYFHPEAHGEHLPTCLPSLPESVSPNAKAIKTPILLLAENLVVSNRFHFSNRT
ncbi:hypothetical protein ZWY2020_038336 [Hordeum vulgare]|nr:hypothetical protein ZWY2020_038336 [Hordeum vulgare]